MAELQVVEGHAEGATPPAAVARKKKSMTPILVAGAVVAGLAAGYVVVGPQFGPKPAAGAHEAAAEAAGGGHGAGSSKKSAGGKGGGAHGSAIEIDNVIVNPAGAQGLHFLMASVILEVADKKAEEYLRANEHVVRDLVVSTLGNRTVEELSRPGAREEVKLQVAAEVENLIDNCCPVSVYLPEFVVQ